MYGEVMRILTNLARKDLILNDNDRPNVEDNGKELVAIVRMQKDTEIILERIVKNFNDRGYVCESVGVNEFKVRYYDILKEVDECFRKYS